MILPEPASPPKADGTPAVGGTPPDAASAAPRSPAGTRARGGNAMARTRAAVLTGALRGVESAGSRRTTMTDVATLGGVAKATVYNHFRTKADVYAALVAAEVERLAEECVRRARDARGGDGLATAVEHAAVALTEHRALRRVAAEEPEVLARLVRVPAGADGAGPGGPVDGPADGAAAAAGGAWGVARRGAAAVLAAAGREPAPEAVEVVLRVVLSHFAWPGDRRGAAALAAAVARALPPDARPDAGAAAGPVPVPADLPVPAPEGLPATWSADADAHADSHADADAALRGRAPSGLGWPG